MKNISNLTVYAPGGGGGPAPKQSRGGKVTQPDGFVMSNEQIERGWEILAELAAQEQPLFPGGPAGSGSALNGLPGDSEEAGSYSGEFNAADFTAQGYALLGSEAYAAAAPQAAAGSRRPALIRFEDVKKIYKMGEVSIEALGGVNFTIDEGEFTVVLGASGAGKSTILNILGGMDKATSGKVTVDGEEVSAYNAKKLTNYRRYKVGFIFQFYNLIANLNALENVEFAASVTHDHLDPKQVLESVGLSDRAKNFPSQLSGGEQQRVAIARAVAKNPMLLLCDEPTGALDYKTGKMVLKLLQDVNEKYKKTVVLITHNSYLAPMADKVIRVKSGKVENIVLNPVKVSVDKIDW